MDNRSAAGFGGLPRFTALLSYGKIRLSSPILAELEQSLTAERASGLAQRQGQKKKLVRPQGPVLASAPQMHIGTDLADRSDA